VEDPNRNIKDKFEGEEAFDQREVVFAGRICKGMCGGSNCWRCALSRLFSSP
jgi:hypothetical protein